MSSKSNGIQFSSQLIHENKSLFLFHLHQSYFHFLGLSIISDLNVSRDIKSVGTFMLYFTHVCMFFHYVWYFVESRWHNLWAGRGLLGRVSKSSEQNNPGYSDLCQENPRIPSPGSRWSNQPDQGWLLWSKEFALTLLVITCLYILMIEIHVVVVLGTFDSAWKNL